MTYLITAPVFGYWIYRANGNARALGAFAMEFTPGWSVGWYFVPVASYWKPFQAMREIWKASKNPMHWQSEPTDPILGWWWFCWITGGILGLTSAQVSMKAHDLPSLLEATAIGIISDVFAVFSISLAFVLITRISRMQIARQGAPSSGGCDDEAYPVDSGSSIFSG